MTLLQLTRNLEHKSALLLNSTFHPFPFFKNVFYFNSRIFILVIKKTRTKTSIRYAKENDKTKRERRKVRERKVEGKI